MTFLKNVLATLVGVSIFFGSFFVLFIIVVAAVSSADKVTVKDNTVLQLSMAGTVVETMPEESLEELVFGEKAAKHGVINIIQALAAAKKDSKVKGVYLRFGGLQASMAAVEEIRSAIKDFRSSGKFVYSFSETYGEKEYYLATASDKIFLHPEGMMEFNGLAANVMFFKGMFDKLDIEPEIFRVGEYKSAIEPFIRKNLSEKNREQSMALISSVYINMIEGIADERNISSEELKTISDQMLVKFPEEAKKYNLIDELFYQDQVESKIREQLSLGDNGKINFLSYDAYKNSLTEEFSKNKVAVVVAEGTIVMGKGTDEQIGAHKFVRELRKVRDNDDIKAVVVRINSPGGSALASDIIWRELKLIKEKKPLITSMSGVAASGGYYMAAATDKIIALPTTITGSIGVFGILANIGEFMENKIGITFDQVKTGEFSDFPNLTRSLNTVEREFIQQGVDRVYDTFLDKVAEGRSLDKEKVKEVAKGRVWSGTQALENGLVDKLGGLTDAVKIAADTAGLGEDFAMAIYPEPKSIMERLIEDMGEGTGAKLLSKRLGIMAPYIDKLNKLQDYTGIQARMPFDISID